MGRCHPVRARRLARHRARTSRPHSRADRCHASNAVIRLVRFTMVSGAVALMALVPDAAARWAPVALGGTPMRDAVQRQRAPRHVALLIGIASYAHFSDAGEPGKTRLHAPVANDIPRMQKSLERWGFLPGDD